MITRYFLTLLFIFLYCCKKNSSAILDEKPDLIIEQITYAKSSSKMYDEFGQLITLVPSYEFTILIKNIGDGDLAQFFYISNSRSLSDFNDKYCSHTQMVNNSAMTLIAGESIEVSISDIIEENVPQIYFLINTNNSFDRGVSLQIIEESNYDNNSYILDMEW